jgi:hypothetical protein
MALMNDDTVKTGIELPKKLLKAVRIATAQREVKMKDAAREAFQAWLVIVGDVTTKDAAIPEVAQQATIPELTEDQRDILAMLAEDPNRDFLFSSLQTTVKHALEQYRSKWKPPDKKTTKARTIHDRRPPATGSGHR